MGWVAAIGSRRNKELTAIPAAKSVAPRAETSAVLNFLQVFFKAAFVTLERRMMGGYFQYKDRYFFLKTEDVINA